MMDALAAGDDLTDCDREPIHAPGAIQPHGILFRLTGCHHRIDAVSANAGDIVGHDPATLLDVPLAALLREGGDELAIDNAPSSRAVRVRFKAGAAIAWRAMLHPCPNGALLDIEWPQPASQDLLMQVEAATARLLAATDAATLSDCLAHEVQALTGHHRVKVYRFAADWHGQVVAEANGGAMPSYLGLHFPASDIPVQARVLYQAYPERQIPDVGYTPVPLIQLAAEPADLGASGLRSVSKLHIEYLRNMGAGASLSFSLLRGGLLSGMVACHHPVRRYVAPDVRKACLLLVRMAAWQLTAIDEAVSLRQGIGIGAVEAKLLTGTAAGVDCHEAVRQHGGALLHLMQASGFAMRTGDTITTLGTTPPEPVLSGVLDWLATRHDDVFWTDAFGEHCPAAAGLDDAAGVLALRLASQSRNLLVWFRPALARTVVWAGNPDKPVAPDVRLSPRLSFAAWTQSVAGRADPWQPTEIAAARGLRRTIVDIILRRATEVERTNWQLAQSNQELEAFAYIASHDLKEPLRQIETFATLLERTFEGRDPGGAARAPDGGTAAEKPRRWFGAIQSSSKRLRTLIDDLADYARLGRRSAPMAPADLGALVRGVTSELARTIEESGAVIELAAPGVVMCDAKHMQQVLQNLIGNALKYRHPDRPPVIRIDVSTQSDPDRDCGLFHQIVVGDNGIGFEPRHAERIFEPFQRLHSADEYEGSGIGLAICRKIIDRHGGTITASGQHGKGAVFTICIPARPLPDEWMLDALAARLRAPVLKLFLARWRAAASPGTLPSFRDFDAVSAEHARHVVLIKVNAQTVPMGFRIESVGGALAAQSDGSIEGMYLIGDGEAAFGSAGSAYQFCVDTRRPTYLHARFKFGAAVPMTFERLLLPYAGASVRVDRLICVAVMET